MYLLVFCICAGSGQLATKQIWNTTLFPFAAVLARYGLGAYERVADGRCAGLCFTKRGTDLLLLLQYLAVFCVCQAWIRLGLIASPEATCLDG